MQRLRHVFAICGAGPRRCHHLLGKNYYYSCQQHLGFSINWGTQMVGLSWTIPLKLMIWGHPYFRKPPFQRTDLWMPLFFEQPRPRDAKILIFPATARFLREHLCRFVPNFGLLQAGRGNHDSSSHTVDLQPMDRMFSCLQVSSDMDAHHIPDIPNSATLCGHQGFKLLTHTFDISAMIFLANVPRLLIFVSRIPCFIIIS